jgi:hypothetical protein
VRRAPILLAVVFGAACNTPSSSSSPQLAGSAGATASAPASASAAAAPAGPSHWSGPYAATAGDLFYPRTAPNAKDWSDLKWNGGDAATGLGAGTISLSVDPGTKLVTGTADGAIGDAVLTGMIDGERLTAKVMRKNPDDRGLTGTIVADLKADAIAGEMKLSSPDAQILRDAKFTLSRQSP